MMRMVFLTSFSFFTTKTHQSTFIDARPEGKSRAHVLSHVSEKQTRNTWTILCKRCFFFVGPRHLTDRLHFFQHAPQQAARADWCSFFAVF